MKHVELSDAAFAALQRLAAAKNISPADVISAMLGADRPPLAGDNLLFFLVGEEFTALTDPFDRHLALLAWAAQNYGCDFAGFISRQESGWRHLALSRTEIQEIRERNHARPIDDTQFWAVMTIDDATRRRFVRRLLGFIGCHDETVAHAIRALGLTDAPAASVC